MKITQHKRIKISIFIAVIGIASLLVGGSYALFNTILISNKNQVIKVGSVAVKVTETGSELGQLILEELTDEEGQNSDIYYSFKVENIGTEKVYYKVLLVDEEGKTNTLDDKYVRANVEIDGDVKLPVNIEETQRLIYQDIIEQNETKEYKLRIWLNFGDLSIEQKQAELNKEAHFKLKVEAEQILNTRQTLTITVENLIKNGSYEQGTSNWSLSSAEVVSTESYSGSSSLKLLGSTTAMTTQMLDYSSPIINHKYYGRLMFKSSEGYTNADNRFEWYHTDNPIALMVFANKNTQTSEWTLLSSIQQITASDYLSESWHIRNFTVNGSSDSYVDDLVIYDLTEIFGEGNEPTKEWCDKNLPYVSDKAEITVYSSGKVEINKQDFTGANVPQLASNMIPVYYDVGESVWKKAGSSNEKAIEKWYDYENGMWANAVTVTEVNGSRSDLVDATPGTPIPMDRINTMWVWIPRFTATGDTVNYNGGTQANPGAFNITFVDKNISAHDAFNFGEAVSGFWMGKFENSSDTTCTITNSASVGAGCNLINIRPKIIPSVASWRGAQMSTFYSNILSMKEEGNPYGFDTTKDINIDTHMLKNNEWGAVAYLSQSIYGRCTSSTGCKEIGINNSSSNITGTGAPAGSSTSVTNGTYETSLGIDASTTGNIYGIYDMSGGAYDYVMGNYNSTAGSYGTIPDAKYINIYTTSEAYTTANLQHALIETSGWYSDRLTFVSSGSPWFLRGGHNSETTSTGIYSCNVYSGIAHNNFTSRSALINE